MLITWQLRNDWLTHVLESYLIFFEESAEWPDGFKIFTFSFFSASKVQLLSVVVLRTRRETRRARSIKRPRRKFWIEYYGMFHAEQYQWAIVFFFYFCCGLGLRKHSLKDEPTSCDKDSFAWDWTHLECHSTIKKFTWLSIINYKKTGFSFENTLFKVRPRNYFLPHDHYDMTLAKFSIVPASSSLNYNS